MLEAPAVWVHRRLWYNAERRGGSRLSRSAAAAAAAVLLPPVPLAA